MYYTTYDLCNDLHFEPAEESVKNMKQIYKDGMNDLKKLREKIDEAGDDPRKLRPCYEEAIRLLEKVKSDISLERESAADAAIDFGVRSVLPIAITIAGIFGFAAYEKKKYNGKIPATNMLLAAPVITKVSSYGVNTIGSDLVNRINTKADLIKLIDREIGYLKKDMKKLNYSSMESFITMCDDLMIPAEESIHQMNKAFKTGMKEIDELKAKIKSAKGDTMVLEDCYEQGIDILQSMKSEIRSYKVSAGDKVVDFVGKALPIVSCLAASFGLDIYFKRKYQYYGTGLDPLLQYLNRIVAEGVAGDVAMNATKALTTPLRGRLDTKKVLMKAIDIELDVMRRALEEIQDKNNKKK